ncbi:MAG: MATE family efflux transporter [Aristaeellaceae bacterium]
MAEARANDNLRTEKLGKLMWRYALPCVISMLVAALYNIVDQIFIANAAYLGSNGNAANTAVFPMTVVAIAIAVMIGDGCCTFVSINLGAGEREKARWGVGSSVLAVVCAGIALMLIYLILQEPILTAFGAHVNEETFRMSKEYFFWITLGIPFYMFGQAMNPIIRSDGSPRFAMLTLLLGAVLNSILDPICIYALHWGMAGAAIATIAGQIASAALAAAYLFRMKAVKLDRGCFAFRPRVARKILGLGSASFLSQISIVLSMAATLNMAVKYGALDPVFGQPEYAQIPTAVTGIIMKFFQIVISTSAGLAAGCIPIAGYNIGAGRNDRVLGLMRRLLAVEALVGLVASAVFLLLPNQLIRMFGAANESIHYTQFAVWYIRGQLCLLPLACLNKGSFIFLQSLGRAKESSVLSIVREIVFGAGFPLLLPMLWGLYALPFFMPAADVLTFMAVAFVLCRVRRDLLRGGNASPAAL